MAVLRLVALLSLALPIAYSSCTYPYGYNKYYGNGKYYKVKLNLNCRERVDFLISICFKKFYNTKEYHQDASDICADDGANLATVKTVDDVNALEEAMHSSNGGPFWIGLKKKSTNTKC